MNWQLVKPWVNRVGILLEFLSFWFAAPQILGERRLRALERRVEGGLRTLPLFVVIVLLVAATVGWVFSLLLLVTVVVPGSVGKPMEKPMELVLILAVGAVAMTGIVLADRLQDRVLRPLLRVLADDKRIRQRSLAVGAVLFVVGFLLQLIATF